MGAPTRGRGSFLFGVSRTSKNHWVQHRLTADNTHSQPAPGAGDPGLPHLLPGPSSPVCPPRAFLSTPSPSASVSLSPCLSISAVSLVSSSLSVSLLPSVFPCLSAFVCLPVCVSVHLSLRIHLSVSPCLSLSPCLCPSLSRSLNPKSNSPRRPAVKSTSWFLREQGLWAVAEVPSCAPRLGSGGQETQGGHVTATF